MVVVFICICSDFMVQLEEAFACKMI